MSKNIFNIKKITASTYLFKNENGTQYKVSIREKDLICSCPEFRFVNKCAHVDEIYKRESKKGKKINLPEILNQDEDDLIPYQKQLRKILIREK